MAASIHLWIVEDEARYREAFERLIETAPSFQLGGSFGCFEDLADRLGRGGGLPDLIVMDLRLPGRSGVEAISELRRSACDVPVLVLSSSDDPESIFGAVRAGATGYLVKGAPVDTTLSALLQASRGGTYFSPSVARYVLGHFAPAPTSLLSDRELEVLGKLAHGRSKAATATELYLSPHTVDSHVRSIYRKLRVRNAAEATATGVRRGLI